MPDLSCTQDFATTLIQVGIPSVVAIVSMAANFYNSKQLNKKDLEIAQLTFNAKHVERVNERKANLINEIISAISSLNNAIGSHTGVFRKINHDKAELNPTVPDTEIQNAYDKLSTAIDACLGSKAKIQLLCDRKISARFELFLTSLYSFQRCANPNAEKSAHDLHESLASVNKEMEQVMVELNRVYFFRESSNA